MLTETEKRAAALAVSQFGADHACVERTVRDLLESYADGLRGDLISRLVVENLLTAAQASELRFFLGETQMTSPEPAANGEADTSRPAESANANGSATPPPVELRQLGRFRILRRLAEGGMGSIYLAYDEDQSCPVAIKVLQLSLAEHSSHVLRFRREARTLERLNHPNIVRFVAFGQVAATKAPCLVLEYINGPSAHTLLDRFGQLAVGDATRIVLDIALALEHAHSRSIIHRDIKPDNILVTLSGLAKLADLGLAKHLDQDPSLTHTRQAFGTPYYMPYEQAVDAKQADRRSDIFALGATFYHLLTGQVPFPGVNHVEVAEKKSSGAYPLASSVNPKVPSVLDSILGKMLARFPEARYQTAGELIAELERSGLAARIPSFTDRAEALQDPVVRTRLVEARQATRIDPELAITPQRSANANVWYIRQEDAKGAESETRAMTWEIVRGLQQKRIQPAALASQDPKGTFKPLAAYPQFAPVVTMMMQDETAPDAAQKPSSS
jgi:serine/threonine-protein kinase